MEILSEHICQGWLEGYLLTGRHGLFSCYEAFIHIVDSMFNQHAKWLKVTRHLPWRRPVASLNYLLTSHVWRQDHNGFSHQDPGFIDHVVNKKAEVIRVYLPPDANTPAVGGRPLPAQPQLRQRDRVRQAAVPGLAGHGLGRPALHPRRRDLGVGQQRRHGPEPDVVLACAGDVPTLEVLAAADILRQRAAGAAGPGGQRGRPDAAAAGHRASARHEGRRVRRAVHHRPAGDLRLPRLPVADPPAHLPAAPRTISSTSAGTSRKAPRPRRSTWWC